MSNIRLRKAQIGDEKILAYIQTESWKSAFADILDADELARCTNKKRIIAMYEKVLGNPQIYMNIMFVDETAHGITAWSRNCAAMGDETAELICIHSLQNQWRKGYGSVMMEQVLQEMKEADYSKVILWVFADNARARAFYEKHGFILSGEEKTANGIRELMYQKKL